jgi:hypothetical protein
MPLVVLAKIMWFITCRDRLMGPMATRLNLVKRLESSIAATALDLELLLKACSAEGELKPALI